MMSNKIISLHQRAKRIEADWMQIKHYCRSGTYLVVYCFNFYIFLCFYCTVKNCIYMTMCLKERKLTLNQG